jgi:hypothetical protein
MCEPLAWTRQGKGVPRKKFCADPGKSAVKKRGAFHLTILKLI